MLTVTGMSAGIDYYRKAVAEGIEEYYQGVGEAPGQWSGHAAHEALGLAGEVDTDDLHAIFSGADPATGEQLGVFTKRSVIGFDLTFKAPKSVSLWMGLGSTDVARQVIEAHEAAVDAALYWIEDDVARTRIGKGGATQVEVNGIVAAKFRHRTSRGGDPHLHTHVLVANAVQGPDGRWRTLDGRMLYTHAKTGGYLYEAALRHELTARLGVDWEPAVNGIADITGIDRTVIEHFSDRRKQILEHMDKLEYRSARAADIAALDTRSKKDTSTDGATMRDVWEAKADEIGFHPDALAEVLDQTGPRALTDQQRADLFQRLIGPEGLTAQASTFDRRAVLEAIAEALPTGATISDVEALSDTFLGSPELVRIVDPAAEVGLWWGWRRWCHRRGGSRPWSGSDRDRRRRERSEDGAVEVDLDVVPDEADGAHLLANQILEPRVALHPTPARRSRRTARSEGVVRGCCGVADRGLRG